MEFLLTNGDYKYWDMVYNPSFYNKANSQVFPLYCYYFDKSGKWLFYQYRKGIRYIYEQDDIEITREWNLTSDSTISLGHKIYKIIKLTNDTLIYKSDNTDSTLLVKSAVAYYTQ